MSATLDEKIFEMFPDARSLDIPGRTFPVEVVYAEEVLRGGFGRISASLGYNSESNFGLREQKKKLPPRPPGVEGEGGERPSEEEKTYTL